MASATACMAGRLRGGLRVDVHHDKHEASAVLGSHHGHCHCRGAHSVGVVRYGTCVKLSNGQLMWVRMQTPPLC